MRELGLADFVAEYQFHETRKWRFDYAIVRRKLAIELEGGIWNQVPGRHTRGRGFQDDLDKYNAATSARWFVFRFSVEDVMRGKDLLAIDAWLHARR